MKTLQYISTIILILTLASCSTGYDNEGDAVYYKDWNESRGSGKRLLENADPKTFEILDNNDYAKDSKRVFYEGIPINGADPMTFEFVGDLYAKDRFRAYYAGDSIQSSSSKDFKIIDSYYSSDHKNIFYMTKPLNVCTTKNFKIFPNPNIQDEYQRWSTDGCYYYFRNYKIPSENFSEVEIFKGSAGFAKDKNWVYFLDHKINFNQEGERIIDTVDVATFLVTGYIECKDKYGCINVYHGREKCE